MTITEFEDKIQTARNEYFLSLLAAMNVLDTGANTHQADSILIDVHTKGVAFFNLFERSIDEFGLPYFELNSDTKNRKIEDGLALVETIMNHWTTVRKISEKFRLPSPSPGEFSYASIQRFILKFKPNAAPQIKTQFASNNLPVSGFEGPHHSGWKIGSKKLSAVQIAVGLLFLVSTAWIAFKIKDLTDFQYLFTRLIMAIGAMLVVTALVEVSIDVKWTVSKVLSVKALGSVAFFIIIYYFNPPPPPRAKQAEATTPVSITNNIDNSRHTVNNVKKAEKSGPAVKKIYSIDKSVHIVNGTNNGVNGDVQVNVDLEKSLSADDKRYIKEQIENAETSAHRKFKYFAVSPAPGSRSLKAVKEASSYLTLLGFLSQFPDGTYPLSNASTTPIRVSFIDSTIEVDISFH